MLRVKVLSNITTLHDITVPDAAALLFFLTFFSTFFMMESLMAVFSSLKVKTVVECKGVNPS